MAGLIALADDLNSTATKMGSTAVELEHARGNEKQMAEGAEKQQMLNSTLGGAAMGAQVGGPWGAFAGALAGLASSKLF